MPQRPRSHLVRALLACALSAALAVGCASKPVNTDPECLPCEEFFENPDTAACPFEPVDRRLRRPDGDEQPGRGRSQGHTEIRGPS